MSCRRLANAACACGHAQKAWLCLRDLCGQRELSNVYRRQSLRFEKRKAAQSELNGFFAKAGATEPRNA
jgi:hypothetical protein